MVRRALGMGRLSSAGGRREVYSVYSESGIRSQTEAGGDALRRLEPVVPVELLDWLSG